MVNPLKIVVHTTVAAPARKCFDYIVPVELGHIFRPYLFLPGVKHTDEAERWFTPGLSRTVYFTDNSKATEELLTVEASRSFTYKISKFTGINRFLMVHIDGAWQFSENDTKTTSIEWAYSLTCHNVATRLIAKTVVAPVLRRYLQRALRVLKQDLEKGQL